MNYRVYVANNVAYGLIPPIVTSVFPRVENGGRLYEILLNTVFISRVIGISPSGRPLPEQRMKKCSFYTDLGCQYIYRVITEIPRFKSQSKDMVQSDIYIYRQK